MQKSLLIICLLGSWYSRFAEKIFNEDPKLTTDKSRTPLLDTIFGGCGQFVLSSPLSSSLVNVDESEEFSVVDIVVLVSNLPLLWALCQGKVGAETRSCRHLIDSPLWSFSSHIIKFKSCSHKASFYPLHLCKYNFIQLVTLSGNQQGIHLDFLMLTLSDSVAKTIHK